jgi:hypothetical protein
MGSRSFCGGVGMDWIPFDSLIGRFGANLSAAASLTVAGEAGLAREIAATARLVCGSESDKFSWDTSRKPFFCLDQQLLCAILRLHRPVELK